MKDVVTVGGIEYERDVVPFNCLFCKYQTGCSAWGCVSAACELTGECFGCRVEGATMCPFDDIYNSDKNRRKI